MFNENDHTQGIVNPILEDITKSIESILDHQAIQLNGVLRQHRDEFKRAIEAKNNVLIEMVNKNEEKKTNKFIKDIEKIFNDEEKELFDEMNNLKMAIIEAIRNQTCDDSKEKMLITVPRVVRGFKTQVRSTTALVKMLEEEPEQQLFINIMSGFTRKFYIILDRVHDATKKAIQKINKTFKTPVDRVDRDYGISAIYDDNLSVSTIDSIKSNSTDVTNATAKLLDDAFNPSIGCITMVGLVELKSSLADIRDKLYTFIFNNDTPSDSVGSSEMHRHMAMLNSGVLGRKIDDGYTSDSSIDTGILSEKIPSFFPTTPPDLRRTKTAPINDSSHFMQSNRGSIKSDDPRLRQPIFKGKILSSKKRNERLYKPLEFNPTRSKKKDRQKSKGGKKHRKTAHKRKNN